MIRILFVCLGNICRSPTAEGVFRKLVAEHELLEHFEIDSAGTYAYNIGKPPDARAQAAAARRGIDLSALCGRQAIADDLRRFDIVLAMDRENYEHLIDICPPGLEHKIRLLMEFAPARSEREIPDPYVDGEHGFDRVLDMIEEAAAGLFEHVRQRLGPQDL